MTKRMLIDASITEETRLVILQGQRLEAFESETERQVKGNIYLARVTRVEPSLQAAFVEYSSNRHGFLAFSEIHSDYFQIPTADRKPQRVEQPPFESEIDERKQSAPEKSAPEKSAPEKSAPKQSAHEKSAPENSADAVADLLPPEEDGFYYDIGIDNQPSPLPPPQEAVSEIPLEAHKKYDIQEVVKRGQLLLVQVVKEERSNKGAALTTLLSLAGRYCVLMPNTDRSSGVSRKASNDARYKMRDIVSELDVPEGMSLIVRTAGVQQPQQEIKRDFEYLTRLWESIRKLTLESKAPSLVYEEGDLAHRALRDWVKKDISEIHIEGHEAYQKAKTYMDLLMPAQAEMLKEHQGVQPLFIHYGIEELLESIHTPIVHLKSGGYIVINPTEALVAIDVNSGKATKEHNLEATALKTNLEAADEIARQVRLRDLAGLLVIDFIDMQDSANIHEVERRLRDAVRHDRARVQVGRISLNFGLLEMSRQRLRAELTEGRVESCPKCSGSGQVPTVKTIALRALRTAIAQAHKTDDENSETVLRVHWPVVLYLLNHKREELAEIERKHNIRLHIEAGGTDDPDKPWQIETRKVQPIETETRSNGAVNMEAVYTQMSPPPPFSPPESNEIKAAGNAGNVRKRHHRQRPRKNKQRHPNQPQLAHKQHSQDEKEPPTQKPFQKRSQKPSQQSSQKPSQKRSQKPSLWQRFLGKS